LIVSKTTLILACYNTGEMDWSRLQCTVKLPVLLSVYKANDERQ